MTNNAPTWGSWFENVRVQAGEFTAKAQELAESAAKVAEEKTSAMIAKASELNVESASTILYSSIGGTMTEQPHEINSKQVKKKKGPAVQLDLQYVTENLIGMAFPCDPSKPQVCEEGNDINAVANFLKKRHEGHFMIWNVSEESYDYSLFGDQVLEYKFPGHPAPPLGLLFKICTSVESWLDADEKNVAVIHCLTGKGRTAALLACILAWIGEFTSPIEALQYVAERKEISVDFLTIPSQRRYVQYFSNMLDGVRPRSEPLLLRRVILNSIPVFGDNAGGLANAGCCPYIQLFKCGKLVATAAPPLDESHNPDTSSSNSNSKLQLKWIKQSEGSVAFSVNAAIQGDILLRCRHADASGVRVSMFRAAFHTGYVPCGVLRLTKAQLDGPSSDNRFDEEFFIDLIFAPIETGDDSTARALPVTTAEPSDCDSNTSTSTLTSSPNSSLVAPNSVPTDSGIRIDTSSADRYELGLHKDARFWDNVASRKARSKKRRSRKFVSNTQEQFSISDEISNVGAALFGDGLSSFLLGSARSSSASGAAGSGSLTGDEHASSSTSSSGVSDMDLIMQLAMAEEDAVAPSSARSSVSLDKDVTDSPSGSGSAHSYARSTAPPATVISAELQALEDLEKELGLDGFQMVSSAGASGESFSSSAAVQSTDDNLDDLEKYLQSLAPPS